MKVFLCCAAGMSTSALMKKTQDAATEQGVELDIIAVGINQFESEIGLRDLCLVAPQIGYKFDELLSKTPADKKLVKIDRMVYGMMDGKKLLAQISEELA